LLYVLFAGRHYQYQRHRYTEKKKASIYFMYFIHDHLF
jgi:hypothetical protein